MTSRRRLLAGLGVGGLLAACRGAAVPTVEPTSTPEDTATPVPPPPTATRPPPTATAVPTREPTNTPAPTRRPTEPPAPTATVPEPSPTAAARPSNTPAATARPQVSVLPELSRVATARPLVALTFDAGGEAGSTAQTLRVLRDRGVRATFFVTGQFAQSYGALVREMVAAGHELANHTLTHSDLTDLSDDRIVSELERTDAILSAFTGTTTKPLMRMPFGARDKRVMQAVARAGYRSIYWAIDGGDWKPGATPGGVIATVKKAAPGDIVVQHCSTAPTAAGLPTILDELGKRGIGVATMSGLMKAG